MESTIKGEVAVTWRSPASFDLMMVMMITRLLYLVVGADGYIN